MAETADQQRIIIKKVNKKGHGGGHHGGAWKVAFADFMTAMMAFFLVMWLVGQKPEVKEAVQGYFRDPGKYQKQGKSGVLKGSDGAIASDISTPTVEPPREQTENPGKAEQEALKLAAQKIIQDLEKEEVFQRLKQNVKLELTSEGLRIILNESEDSPAFFEPGSAKLLQKSAIILVTIARELGKLPNRVVMEGHTSSGDTGSKDYTNWELSADRANAARQLMEVEGLYPGQVREVRGFADKFPMITDNPVDARNRRVTLMVLFQARDKKADQVEVGTDLMKEAAKDSTVPPTQ